MVDHVHLRDVRGEDLDLSPTTAQVHQHAVWEGTKADSEMCPTQLHLLTRSYKRAFVKQDFSLTSGINALGMLTSHLLCKNLQSLAKDPNAHSLKSLSLD